MKARRAIIVLLIVFLAACKAGAESIPSRISETATSTSASLSVTSSVPTESNLLSTADASWHVCDGAKQPNYKTDLSPNGEWLVVICNSSNSSSQTSTKVFRLDGSLKWQVPFYTTFGVYQKSSSSPDGIRDGEMKIVHWSSDNKNVYLTPYLCCLDEPENIFFNYFQKGPALYQMDLQTGEVKNILHPYVGNEFAGYGFAFSPDDKYLAYIGSEDLGFIYIYSLQDATQKKIPLGNDRVGGGILWFPDGGKLIIITSKGNWSVKPSNTFAYYLVDTQNTSLKLLFEKQELYFPSWSGGANLILAPENGNSPMLFNFSDNSFSPAPTELIPNP